LARLVLLPVFGLLGAILAFLLFYGGVLGILMVRVGGLRTRDLGITLQGWPKEVMLGIAGFLAVSVLLLGWIFARHGAEAVTGIVDSIAGFSLGERVFFLGIGLLAASAEDTLFRGYMQPALMTRFGAAAGIFLTMALFQVHHFTDWPTVDRVGSLCITGLGFGVLRWQKRPLIASYTAHTVLWLIWGHT
jgi:membrane protease YdiL (CAAX protease family)